MKCFKKLKIIYYILIPIFLVAIFSCEKKSQDETPQVVKEVVTIKISKMEENVKEESKINATSKQPELTFNKDTKKEANINYDPNATNNSKLDNNSSSKQTDSKIINPTEINNSVLNKGDVSSQNASTTPILNSSIPTESPATSQSVLIATPQIETKTSDNNNEVLQNEDISVDISEEKLFYIAKGKIDPFEPLIKEKPPVEETKEVFEEDVPQRILTPLEKLDFSQMKLVAILNRSSGSVAMVQEATGKGYIVNIGTYMGRNSGQVISIEKDKLVIQEKVKDYKGNFVDSFQELKLNKLDDKG